MERATVMKTLHGNLIPKSLTMRDRDASFSSYLRPDKPITCQPHHHHHDAIGSTRFRYADDTTTELSIFDAHKYFNSEVTAMSTSGSSSNNSRVSPLANTDKETNIAPEKGGDKIIGNTITRYSSASSSVDGAYTSIRNYRARSFHGAATPTASSEASWNSQVGLLSHRNDAGAVPVSMRDPQNTNDLNKKLKASLSKPIWILRRKCPCTGKKSVQVKENATPPPPPPPPPPPQPKTQVPKQQEQQQRPQPQPLKDHSLTVKTHDHDRKSMIMNTMMDTATPKSPKDVPIIAPNDNWAVDKVATIASPTFVTTNSNSQRFHSHRIVASSSVRVPFSDGFTFPVLNPHASAPTAKLRAQNGVVLEEVEDQPPRDSLEVFQPPNDAVEPTSDSPNPRTAAAADDDAASDASSDLFEIESFSAGGAAQSPCPVVFRRTGGDSAEIGNGFLYGCCRRRSMDEGSTAAMTECYEPSEASVEWSVTTAEGCYEESVVDGGGGGGGGGGRGDVAGEKWRRKVGSSGNGGLLLAGCRCEKAVSVGPQPVRKQCGGSGEGQRGATCGSRRVNVNVIMNTGVGGSRVGLGSCSKPPLPLARPHNNTTTTTPRMSLAFVT